MILQTTRPAKPKQLYRSQYDKAQDLQSKPIFLCSFVNIVFQISLIQRAAAL